MAKRKSNKSAEKKAAEQTVEQNAAELDEKLQEKVGPEEQAPAKPMIAAAYKKEHKSDDFGTALSAAITTGGKIDDEKFKAICDENNVDPSRWAGSADARHRDAARQALQGGLVVARFIEVSVSSASLDEPETLFVEETEAVGRALRALRAACDETGDGEVEVRAYDHWNSQRGTISTEEEFLEWAANFIGGTAEEIEAMLTKWRA